jgi:hypothetical protein
MNMDSSKEGERMQGIEWMNISLEAVCYPPQAKSTTLPTHILRIKHKRWGVPTGASLHQPQAYPNLIMLVPTLSQIRTLFQVG